MFYSRQMENTVPVKGIAHYTRAKRVYYTHITRSVHAVPTQCPCTLQVLEQILATWKSETAKAIAGQW